MHSHTFLVGIQNGTVTSANSSAVFYKSKHTLLLSSFHSLVFTRMNRKRPQKNLHKGVLRSFIHNC